MKKEKIVIFNRFGERLDAVLRKPDNLDSAPAVLFVSGLGMDLHEWDDSFDEIALVLSENGFITLQFSFSGCGNSGGNYQDMTVTRQASQIEDVLYYLNHNEQISVNRVGIIAQSFGVPSVLCANLEGISKLLFISGAFNAYENLKSKFIERRAYNPGGISRYPRSSGGITIIGSEFWPALKAFKEKDVLNKLNIPTYIIHGSLDDKISVPDTKLAFQLIPTNNKKFKLYPKGDHGIVEVSSSDRRDFLKEILNWFKND